MRIDERMCYQALTAKDARFDGLFFVGVTTTGIYCRPICPARTPRADRCRYFPSAASAEERGFRPCLRCRPELAPGSAPVDAAGRLAHGIAVSIQASVADGDRSLEDVAAELGVGSRQARRVLRRELGVSPVRLAQTHRLLLAKQLLSETNLSMTQVALASGFASVRRFNALFQEHYRLTPGEIRRSRPSKPNGAGVRLALSYRAPLAWDALLRFLRARAIAGVELVDEHEYARTVQIGEHCGWIRVRPDETRLALQIELSASLVPVLGCVLGRVRNLLDLAARPDAIDVHLGSDSRLARLVSRCPGLRVPGAFCGFELAWRAVLGQQVTVRAATTIASRVVRQFGEPLVTLIPGLDRVSPTSARLAGLGPKEWASVGVLGSRGATIRALATAMTGGRLRLDPTPAPSETVERLRAIRGVGAWTAEYIAMRALRWPDAFPETDLVLRRALGRNSMASACWSPWRAYAAMHLWNAAAAGMKGMRNGKSIGRIVRSKPAGNDPVDRAG